MPLTKGLDRLATEVLERGGQDFMRPIPPGDALQRVPRRLVETIAQDPPWIFNTDGIVRHVLNHDAPRSDHRADADTPSWHHHRDVIDPGVMTDLDPMSALPVEKRGVVVAEAIGRCPIRKMVLRGPVHRVISGINAGVRGDRHKFTDARVNDLGIAGDIAVGAKDGFRDTAARPYFGIGAKDAISHLGGRIDQGVGAFFEHARHRVGIYADAPDALAAMRENPPDVVLIGEAFGGLTCADLLRAMREYPETANIPVALDVMDAEN